MKKTGPDYYGVMGVKRDASLATIKQAHRELVRRYHPDAAGESAEARRQFELLQEAYEVLSDPARRAQYDKTLPRQKYPLAELDAPTLWKEVTDLVLERADAFGPMLQAMRVAVPLALEDSVLIIGVAGKDQYLAGHLETPANRHHITQALREVAGRDIEYRVIEGDTVEDWEWVQRAEGRRPHPEPAAPSARPAAAPAEGEPAAEQARPRAPQVTEWELLGRKIHNTWQGTPGRQHPVTRAEFLLTCVNWISDTAKHAAEEGEARDTIQREVGKALERVAHLLELPTAVVALELVRGSPRRRRP